MKTTKIKVRVTYTEELLGTLPANDQLYDEYIASNAPDAMTRKQEIEMFGVEQVADKGMTVFPRLEDGRPFIYDYQWKGFFKEACGMLRRADDTLSKKAMAYKKVIDGNVFVQGEDAANKRAIVLRLPKGGMVGCCQRPLRADTPQGQRVAIASSETVPAGTVQEFTVVLLNSVLAKLVLEWLDYGELHGTGQWRNSGKGSFVYAAYDEKGKWIGGTDAEAEAAAKAK